MKALHASGAGVWANCPGSTALPRHERPDTPEAIEGTLCHSVARAIGTGIIRATDSAATVNANPDFNALNNTGLLVTDEHLELALTCSAFCATKTTIKGAWEAPLREGDLLPVGVVGTPDFIGYDVEKSTLHVVDNKFGFTPVDAVGNWQLLIYSWGAAGRHYRAHRGGKFPIRRVHLHICQPRDYVKGAFKSWEMDRAQWNVEVEKIHGRIGAAKLGRPARTGAHCRFCQSRTFCAAFAGVAASVLETVQTDPEIVPTNCLGAEYAYLLRAEAVVLAARKGFEDKISYEIENERPVKGWRFERAAGRRYWKADLAEIKAVARMGGATLTKETPVALGAAWKNKSLRPLLETLVEKREGKRTLVPYNEGDAKIMFSGGLPSKATN